MNADCEHQPWQTLLALTSRVMGNGSLTEPQEGGSLAEPTWQNLPGQVPRRPACPSQARRWENQRSAFGSAWEIMSVPEVLRAGREAGPAAAGNGELQTAGPSDAGASALRDEPTQRTAGGPAEPAWGRHVTAAANGARSLRLRGRREMAAAAAVGRAVCGAVLLHCGYTELPAKLT